MKFLFFVQGEGRGHMTQAIALSKILQNAGHQISKVMIGKSPHREIPAFFYDRINAPVETFESPNYTTDKENKSIKIPRAIFNNLKNIRKNLKVINKLKKILEAEKPDAIVNFYDLLTGILYLLYKPEIPMFCVANQYLALHPEYSFPKGHIIDKFLLKLNTRLTASNSKLLLALSFAEMPSVPALKIIVVPPLIRSEVLDLQVEEGGYFLGYLLNSGYADEVIAWKIKNPETELHFFWDNKEAPAEKEILEGLTFYKLNDQNFLNLMKGCRGFAGTTGFQSICEAMYLSKPILLVPTGGHFEQECNAFNARNLGAGVVSKEFDLSKLIEFIPHYRFNHIRFRNWVKKSNEIFLHYLTSRNN